MTLNPDKDLAIDPDALDHEWLQQAHLAHRYGEACAKAKQAMETAKEGVEVLAAELQLEIRGNPTAFKLEKLTETLIAAAVTTHPKMIQAVQAANTARHEYELINAARWAVDAKRTSLENLVKLLQMNYFAGPSSPHKLDRISGEQTMSQASTRSVVRRRLNA